MKDDGRFVCGDSRHAIAQALRHGATLRRTPVNTSHGPDILFGGGHSDGRGRRVRRRLPTWRGWLVGHEPATMQGRGRASQWDNR